MDGYETFRERLICAAVANVLSDRSVPWFEREQDEPQWLRDKAAFCINFAEAVLEVDAAFKKAKGDNDA